MPKAAASKEVGPSPNILQEMRNLVSVLCREACMTDKATGETVGGQMQHQEKVFHGSTGCASLLTNCLSGKGPTASMYNRIPIESNREGNEGRHEGHMLVLRDMLTCEEGTQYMNFSRQNVMRAELSHYGVPAATRILLQVLCTLLASAGLLEKTLQLARKVN